MIEHEGIIEKVNDNSVIVRILQRSACSDCHAKSTCMVADSKEKIVEISDVSKKYAVSEKVIIEGKESIGYKAILWAFVVPILILLSTLIISLTIVEFSESEAAVTAIIALAPYYFILYLLRDKMAKSFRFNIKNTN